MTGPRNPILIGQAQEIDLLQPQVRAMLERQGVYIGGDTKRPDLCVVLFSQNGHVFDMKLDHELNPERFFDSLTLHGPYGPQPPEILDKFIELLTKAHGALDALMAQLIVANPNFRPTKSECWPVVEAIADALKQTRGAA